MAHTGGGHIWTLIPPVPWSVLHADLQSVGMNRIRADIQPHVWRVPRVCGDEPTRETHWSAEQKCSPRLWVLILRV